MPLEPSNASIESSLREIAKKLVDAANALQELRHIEKDIFRVSEALRSARSTTIKSEHKIVLEDFSTLSGVDAMCHILVEANEPLKKDDILAKMKARGKEISKGTLEAYLSTEKGRFKSHGGGYWGLVDKVYS